MSLLVPISWGELLDKISILEIKTERIGDEGKLANIRKELQLLKSVRDENEFDPEQLADLYRDLVEVNKRLWDIEDDIRELESKKEFGNDFIELARSVYRENDMRANLKKQINIKMGSDLIEEKSYKKY